MAEVAGKIKFTCEDYKSLPEPKTKRYELLGGELALVPSPRNITSGSREIWSSFYNSPRHGRLRPPLQEDPLCLSWS